MIAKHCALNLPAAISFTASPRGGNNIVTIIMTIGIMQNTPLVRIAASGNIEYANNRRRLEMLAQYTFLSDI